MPPKANKPAAPKKPTKPSAKSKTGNTACSQAASNWQLSIRGKEPLDPQTYATLAKCRAMTRTAKQADDRARMGYNLNEQGAAALKGRLQKRFDQGLITQKSRDERLKTLLQQRKEKQAAVAAKPADKAASLVSSVRQKPGYGVARASAAGNRELVGLKMRDKGTVTTQPAFTLKQSSSQGGTGAGRSMGVLFQTEGTALDKAAQAGQKAPLPGQTGLFEKKPAFSRQGQLAPGRGTDARNQLAKQKWQDRNNRLKLKNSPKTKYDANYKWARSSEVGNIGEDVGLSARHIRNAWRNLEDAEKRGLAEMLVTREKLMKNEPHNLHEMLNENNARNVMEAHLAIKLLPAAPEKKTIYLRNAQNPRIEVTPEMSRAAYFKVYQFVKNKSKELIENSSERGLQGHLFSEIHKEIKSSSDAPYRYQLQNVASKLLRRGPTGIDSQLHTIAQKAGMTYNKEQRKWETPSDYNQKLKTVVAGILGGKSITERPRDAAGEIIKPSDIYINNKVTREGGAKIDFASHDSATKYLTEKVGVRGIQFGNSMTDDERKSHLMNSAQAVKDLSLATKLPENAVGLKGLALAYGARGKGGAVATYERGKKVINLTRNSGTGALAHEWAHGVDHAASAEPNTYLSSTYYRSGTSERLANAMRKFRETAIGFTSRVREEIAARKIKGGAKYWASPEEIFARSFEKHTSRELEKLGVKNTYLTSSNTSTLWPNQEEQKKMAPAIRSVMRAYRDQQMPGKNTPERNNLAREISKLRNARRNQA